MEKHIDKDCIFCKLANGEIPTTSIYEDEDFNVIMDLGPASRGHSIILPKTHAANLYELPDDYCSKIMGVAKKCAAAMKKSLNCDGLNVLQNNGEAAGQTVFHLHVHLIPRYSKKEGFGLRFDDNSSKYDSKKLQEIANQIASKVEK